MSTANLFDNLPSLALIVDRQPLTVDPGMLLVEVISLMSQAKGRECLLPIADPASSEARSPALEISVAARHSAVLVLANDRLVGILTERDLVKLAASQTVFQGVTIGDVMTTNPHTLELSNKHTVMTALSIFQQQQIRHLPILDDCQQLVGIVTLEQICQVLQPVNLLYIVENLQSQLLARTTQLEQSNWELQTEAARRTQVEAELRRASQTLEERVVARTAELALLTQKLHVQIAEQRASEIALEASQQGISDFIENAAIGMAWIDLEGNIVWVNQAELNLFGYDRSQYLSQSLINYHVDQAKIADLLRRVSQNELIKNCEAQVWCKDGSICDVSIDAQAFFKDGKFIHARLFTRDITERKQVERERERFLAVASELQLILGSNGYFHWVSPKFESTLDWTVEEMTSCQWTEFIHPDDIDLSVALEANMFDGNELITFENRYRHKDGSYRWFSWNAQLVPEERVIYAVAVDVTARKAKEQKIQEQAALLDIATDAIVVRDLNNEIQFWNKGAESIYGWRATEAIGQKTTELFYVNMPPEIEIAANAVRQQGAWQGELHKRTKAGKAVIVESRWTLVRDEAGNPSSILSVDTDITEKKSLEQQFLRAQRLESLGSLASGIAHDLNNVLTPIVGAAQLLPMTLPNLDERSRRLLDMLVDSSKRGSGLVKQILTFAQGMDGERTTLQVRHILSEIISVARQTFPKSIKIRLNLEREDLWMVNVDATQIHQVFMNLFINARDAMPDGGEIVATAENIIIDADYPRFRLQTPMGAYIKITVADTGSGMNAETLARIFDPFFTTKETGTGLGLSTVIGIVRVYGGAIDVESEVGRGTSFKIYLPAIIDIKESEPQAQDELIHDGKGQLVLVVDDEAAIRDIIKESLEEYNYRVMLANDGIEAITIYTHTHHSIAIVLMDMIMPNLDPKAAIKALQQINTQVQIVVMSGSLIDLEAMVDKHTVKAFVTKPFTIAALLQVLASIGI